MKLSYIVTAERVLILAIEISLIVLVAMRLADWLN